MWLQEFHALFREATEHFTGRQQNLAEVERLLDGARRSMRVGRRELQAIEDSPAWSYASWWPRLSNRLERDLPLPSRLTDENAKRQAISDLYAELKHIEVVSVLLRFLQPQEFGIISPPVLSLLSLMPIGEHVEHYLSYVSVLKELANHYGMPGAADVDMALWSAFHLSQGKEYAALTEEMNRDDYFLGVRLKNLLEGLTVRDRWSDRHRCVFATALVKHDYRTAAAIAARAFESGVRELAQRLSIYPTPKPKQSEVGSLVEKLNGRPELRSLGLGDVDLVQLWKWRGWSVHGNPDITRGDAEIFVRQVCLLWDTLERSR